MYIQKESRRIPILCTLHNASYQGHIMRDLDSNLLNELVNTLNLPKEDILSHFVHDGQFNMLSGLVSYIHREQDGKGICAVSNQYSDEVQILHKCLKRSSWTRPNDSISVDSLPNPELCISRPSALVGTQSIKDLRQIKAEKKADLQKALGLDIDPTARIGAFVGRMVAQKGVDSIADCASKLLLKHLDLQLIMVGPVGDVFGTYATSKMSTMLRNPLFEGRVFFKPAFYLFTAEMKLGCDFAMMPSRTEPFGFVDIEFAWCGCAVVGSLVGGLGKTPGWYYKVRCMFLLDVVAFDTNTS
jgi:glycogen synthase